MSTAVILNMIFLLTMYPVLIILYLVLRYSTKSDGKYCFGVTRTREWKNFDQGRLVEIEHTFRKSLRTWLIVFAVIPVVTFFIPYFSITFSIWMAWLLGCIFVPFIPFARANEAVQEWKENEKIRHGLSEKAQERAEISYAEMEAAGTVRKVKAIPFLIPTVISLAVIPVCFWQMNDRSMYALLICVAAAALCTPLSYLLAVLLDKQKTTVICEDAEVNLNYTRAKKQIWKNLWLILAWTNTGFTWIIAIFLYGYETNGTGVGQILWGSIAFCLIALAESCLAFLKMQEIEKKYTDMRTEAHDSDKYWKWGLIYYNPNDRHVMVEQRVGIGSTTNMATKVGKGTMGFALAALLALPVLCVWMILEEFTPIHLAVENDAIVANHLNTDYVIPIDDILEVTVIQETPKWSRVNGSAMENMEKGTFEIYREGTCSVFLNPKNNFFMKVQTEEETYYLGGYDDAETEEVYQIIKLD